MSNSFSICKDCTQLNTCVLTSEKSQVWDCSEYTTEEITEAATVAVNIKKVIETKTPKHETEACLV